jgi:deferrochelatase/peroxidase EfeB
MVTKNTGITASPQPAQLQLPLPEPLFTRPYQNGITDPMWPEDCPDLVDPKWRKQLLKSQMASGRIEPDPIDGRSKRAQRELYRKEYSGRVARQDFQSTVRFDVTARDRAELIEVLKQISAIVIKETEKKPSTKHLRPFDPILDSYRVTITVAFGASLFVDQAGFDRYGLAGRKPKFLKQMPSFPGDAPELNPAHSASDLLLVVSSDHPYINIAIVRYFAEFFNKEFRKEHPAAGGIRDVLKFRDVQEGFARKDKREFLRFDDGIENLQIDPKELRRLVYIDESDSEPPWCLRGSYLVYRKIREHMPIWEALQTDEKQQIIGREEESGLPLGQTDLTPDFFNPKVPSLVALNAHIRKVQPRRPEPDQFGINDLERRFLRRPYPFFDGLDPTGQAINGLQFIAFMKSIQQQFEHVVNMWQMNPDFPVPGTGIDALYAKGILSTIDGGYYFCPPGLKSPADFFGSGMFAEYGG